MEAAMVPTTEQIDRMDAALREARTWHANAHNASFLKGNGNTGGRTADLMQRWDDLAMQLGHITHGRSKAKYTVDEYIAACEAFVTDAKARALELGYNDRTHEDSFNLALTMSSDTDETRAERKTS
jgi:hypothetical protein